jgi:hypothetical protein
MNNNNFAIAINTSGELLKTVIEQIHLFSGSVFSISINFNEHTLKEGNFIVIGETSTGINVQVQSAIYINSLNLKIVKLTEINKVFELLHKYIEYSFNKNNNNKMVNTSKSDQEFLDLLSIIELAYSTVKPVAPVVKAPVTETVEYNVYIYDVVEEVKPNVQVIARNPYKDLNVYSKTDYKIHDKFVRIGFKFYPISTSFLQGRKYVTYNGSVLYIGTTADKLEKVLLIN